MGTLNRRIDGKVKVAREITDKSKVKLRTFLQYPCER
jgi:hypothetical protein